MENVRQYQLPEMSDREFNYLKDLVNSQCGIKLSPVKKCMLNSRLVKRLRALGLNSFRQYCQYLKSNDGLSKELPNMLDLVTTNKTEFFREKHHFDFLSQHILPQFVSQIEHSGQKDPLVIWSAGCSSGEEPYTLAMVLASFFEKTSFQDFSIIGTDICNDALHSAKQAIYSEEKILPIPKPMKKKYLMQGKGPFRGFYRVVPELRKKVVYRYFNLLNADFGNKESYLTIFCRNTMIYFDKKMQADLLEKFYAKLVPGGYLFIGHSETLQGQTDKFERVAVSVYKKRNLKRTFPR